MLFRSALAKVFSVLFRIIPKVGPFRGMTIKASTPETEKLFLRSFDTTVDYYRILLGRIRATGNLDLQNLDLDTGEPAGVQEYRLADRAYAELLHKLSSRDPQDVPPSLRENILKFYGDTTAHVPRGKDRDEWQKTLSELTRLRSAGGQSGLVQKK